MDALGAQRIPDPTTAGDFTRRFSVEDTITLMECINEARKKFWRVTKNNNLKEALINIDGTIAPTYGECKEGMDISYKGIWGYAPLIITLANTKEAWYGLLMSDVTRGTQILKMEFRSFLHKIILMPYQIIKRGRRIIYRALGYNDWLEDFFNTWALIKQLRHT
jgi:hypothetical protein